MRVTSVAPANRQIDSGETVTLIGTGFGTSEGSVLIAGQAQTVTSWSDTSITFTTVRGSQSLGACRVDVVAGSSHTPTVIVTNQSELDTELAKSAAALEGQVIGVQYNATPYVITRSGTPNLANKDFGAGGLVITQYGGTMPVFSSIAVDDSRNITFHSLEVHQNNDNGGAYGGLIALYDNAWDITFDSCKVHGKYYDPNGNYSTAGSYGQGWVAIAPSLGSGKYLKNITIKNCEFYDLRRGHGLTVSGSHMVEGNVYHDLYEDPISLGYTTLGAGTSTTRINWNQFYRPIGLGSDADNPHLDFIQFLDPGAVTWTVEVIGNIGFVGNARGHTFQGIFANLTTSGAYLAGKIAGNLMLTNSLHGITIDRASGLTVIGNTCVSGDVDGGGLNCAINIGEDATTGTHVAKNNVAHNITVAGSPTLTNNHTATRSTAAYAALFNGTAFDKATLSSRSAVLSALAMKAGGALDQAVNIGAVGSGYVDYDARTINEAME